MFGPSWPPQSVEMFIYIRSTTRLTKSTSKRQRYKHGIDRRAKGGVLRQYRDALQNAVIE